MRILAYIVFFFFCISNMGYGQTAHNDLRMADRLYEDGDFLKAEQFYRNAVVKEPSAQAKFNLGNSLFEQERFEEAAKEFQQAVNLSNDTMFRAKALYNKGNSLLSKGDLGESLKAYKKSLILNPNDEDAKRNFMFALQQQQQQQQQQEEQQENEEQNQDQNQEGTPPPPQNEEQQQEEQPQQEQEQEQKQEEEQPQPEEKEMDRDEAEQLLQIIENTDSYVQKKLKKQSSTKKQGEKDW